MRRLTPEELAIYSPNIPEGWIAEVDEPLSDREVAFLRLHIADRHGIDLQPHWRWTLWRWRLALFPLRPHPRRELPL